MFPKSDITPVSISTGTIVRVLLVCLGAYLLWFLRDLVLILLTSIVISSFVESATPFFRRMKINRVFGIVSIYVFSVAAFAVLFYLFAPLLITEVYNFANLISSYIPGVDFLEYFKDPAFSGAKDVVANLSGGFSLQNLMLVSESFISNLSGGFIQTLSVAFGSIFNVIVIILLSFYLSVQEKGIENFLRLIIPIRYEDKVIDLWQRSRHKIGLWFKGQLLLSVLVAVLTYLVLSLLGVKYALLLSLIAGAMEMVPYGIIVALVPAVSFSYLDGGLPLALMVLGAYLIIQQFEAFLLTPLIINQVVGLSPIMIILAILAGFELGGVWGVLLAIPVAVFITELLNDIEKHKTFVKNRPQS